MEKQKFLKKLWEDLMEFKRETSISEIDVRKNWIIDAAENRALDTVIGAVSDCMENGIATENATNNLKEE